jgi:hypothetical protein
MGHKHIDSLRRTVTTTSQERVEKDSLSANKWNEVDGRKTDVRTTKPTKITYAKITKERKLSLKREEVSKNTPLTFKNESHRKNSLIDSFCRYIYSKPPIRQ